MSNPNMPRWVMASMSKYIKDQCTDDDTYKVLNPLFEGDDRPKAITDAFNEWRLLGPVIQSPTRGETIEYYTLDCLVSCDSDTDAYRILTHAGLVSSLFIDFQIYRFGLDDSLVGCITQMGRVDILQYGQLTPKVRVKQASVSAKYCLYYKE